MRKFLVKWISLCGFTLIIGTVLAVNSNISTNGDFATDLGVQDESYTANDISSFTPIKTELTSTCLYRFSGCSRPNTCNSDEQLVVNNTGWIFTSNQCCKKSGGILGTTTCRPAPPLTQNNCGSSFLQGNFFWASCCTQRIPFRCNTGITSISVPNFEVAGPKPEGIWLLSVERDVPAGTLSRRRERTTSIIKHDLTPPHCVGEDTYVRSDGSIGVNWDKMIGFERDGTCVDWASDLITLDPSAPSICRDKVTYDGKPTSEWGGAGCYKYSEILLTEHGQSKTFPITDRLGNSGECTTPPTCIDCRPPEIDPIIKLEHKGLSFPETNVDSTLPGVETTSTFRADDGPLVLKFGVFDPEDSTCGKSGLNWDALIANEELGNKKTELLDLFSRKRDKESALGLIQADIYTHKILVLKNLLKKVTANIKLHIWKDITLKLNNSSSTPNVSLSSLESLSPSLIGKTLDKVSFLEIIDVLKNINFRADDKLVKDEVLGIISELEVKNLANTEYRYKIFYPESIAAYIRDFSVNEVDGLNPFSGTEALINTFKTDWEISIKNSDFTQTIPNWLSVLDAEELEINGLYAEYQRVLNLLDESDLNIQFKGVGIGSLSSILDDIINGSEITKDHVGVVKNGVTPLNGTFGDILSYINVYKPTSSSCATYVDPDTGFDVTPGPPECGDFNINLLNQLLSQVDTFELNVSELISDVDAQAGVIGEPLYNFAYYFGDIGNAVALEGKLKDLRQDIQNIESIITFENLSIKDLEAQIDTKIMQEIITIEERISVLRAEISAIETQELANGDPKELRISHLDIGRCLDSSCSTFSKTEKFINTNIQSVSEGRYEWDLNQEQYEGEHYPIFSQTGLYKVILRIYDHVGSPAVEKTAYIQIHPSKADKNKTTLSSDCVRSDLWANYEDRCQISLNIRDEFENIIKENSSIELYIKEKSSIFEEGQDIEGSYDVVEKRGENYLNGIRFDTGVETDLNGSVVHKISWQSNQNAERQFNVRAIIPSVHINLHKTDITSGDIEVINRELPLNIISPTVSSRGVVEIKTQIFDKIIDSRFKPWVFLRISDKANDKSPTNPWKVELEVPYCFYTYSSTADIRGEGPSSIRKLPEDFIVYVKGHPDAGIGLRNEDLTIEKEIFFRSIDATFAEAGGNTPGLQPSLLSPKVDLCTELYLQFGKVSLQTELTSRIQYPITEDSGKIRILNFPGTPLGAVCDPTKHANCESVIPPKPYGCNASNQCVENGALGSCTSSNDCESLRTYGCNASNQCVEGGVLGSCSSDGDCSVLPPATYGCNASNQCVLNGALGSCSTHSNCTTTCDESIYCCPSEEPCGVDDTCDIATECCEGEVGYPDCVITETAVLTAGFDVEGGFLVNGSELGFVESDAVKGGQSVHLGDTVIKDVREEITRNAFKLTRGKPSINNKNSVENISLTDLEDGGVTYIKGGMVRLGSSGILKNILFKDSSGSSVNNGTHTLIIEDGNLVIDGDLSYGNGGVLGVMLVNTTYENEPENGNIFINNNVNEFVGIYFADGGVTSTWKHGTNLVGDKPGFYESTPDFDRETIDYLNANTLREQLILTGSLLTRNTLGGSQIVNIVGPWGPMIWSDAIRYDLHYIRRYAPVYDPITDNHDNKAYCTKLDGVTCYENKHSFVIRIDENIKNNPPPGFKTGENTRY